MQRRVSLEETSKTPRFKSRRSQSSISSFYDVFACKATSEGHNDLSISGRKLRNEKNLNGDQRRNTAAGAAKVKLREPFEEGEQTLLRPDHHHHEDPQKLGDDFEREEIEKSQRTSDCSEAEAREELLLKGRPNRRPRAIVAESNNLL